MLAAFTAPARADTPLHEMARLGADPEWIEMLIADGADPNTRTKERVTEFGGQPVNNLHVAGCPLIGGGETPLHKAASYSDNPATVEALIAGGADPHARIKSSGQCPVAGDGFTLLHVAAIVNDNPAIIEALIAGGADPNARTKNGIAPLHYAAGHNDNPAVVEALIAGGADLKALTNGGLLPLDYAKDNKALQRTEVYWRLNQARFE